MARLLCAFGIRQVGQKAAKVLAMHFGTLDKLMAATEDELMAIPDVGPTTAAYLRAWFANPQSQHQIRLLRAAGVSFESKEQIVDHRFAGKTFVLTGALEHFSRDEAGAIIERFGGKTSSSVSKKDVLSAGRGEHRVQVPEGAHARHADHYGSRISGHDPGITTKRRNHHARLRKGV